MASTFWLRRLKNLTTVKDEEKIKRNIGVELAVDALENSDRIDHLVLFSGDGDLRALVEAVQRRGVRVTVVSTIRTRPPIVADELRRQADSFLELDDFKGFYRADNGTRWGRVTIKGRLPENSSCEDKKRPPLQIFPAIENISHYTSVIALD